MSYYVFTIPGKPCGKARPRVTRNGAFNTKQTRGYEAKVQESFFCTYGTEAEVFSGPVVVTVDAYYPIPKSTPKRDLVAIKNGDHYPTKKPDIDNVFKIIADALNGVAYQDDKQIIKAQLSKRFGNVPKVVVIVSKA